MGAMIKGRVFVVGCPRSGTTLLQCFLAANSRIDSFPESHFFESLFSSQPILSTLGIARRKARVRLARYASELGYGDARRTLPPTAITVRQLSSLFVQLLDTLTLEHSKSVWVEKTPGHVQFARQIEKLVPHMRMIHILRNGMDVIASLRDVAQRYADGWGPGYVTLDQCIQRWLDSTRSSLVCAGMENHFLVRYEELVDDPRAVLPPLCEFIDVPYEEQMLSEYRGALHRVVNPQEVWKNQVGESLYATRGIKFKTVLSAEERQHILRRLAAESLTDLSASTRIPPALVRNLLPDRN